MQILFLLFANVVSNTTIILMYDEPGPETFMINIAIFSKTVFCFPYETKNIISIYNNIIIVLFCTLKKKWLENLKRDLLNCFKQFKIKI